MSSEEERAAGVVLRELRADRPCSAVCDCARCEYDRRILNAMIQQIEQRVLAQCTINPTVCPLKQTGDPLTAEDIAEINAEVAAQHYEAHDHGTLTHRHFTKGEHDHPAV